MVATARSSALLEFEEESWAIMRRACDCKSAFRNTCDADMLGTGRRADRHIRDCTNTTLQRHIRPMARHALGCPSIFWSKDPLSLKRTGLFWGSKGFRRRYSPQLSQDQDVHFTKYRAALFCLVRPRSNFFSICRDLLHVCMIDQASYDHGRGTRASRLSKSPRQQRHAE